MGSSEDADARRPIVVLQSFPEPTARSNPYVTLLLRSLRRQPGVTAMPFSYRRALAGRYDAFHAHWPENLVTGKRPATTAIRQLLFLAILLRLRLTRTPLIRTLHNVELPSGLNRRQRGLLRLAQRWTSLFLTLNDATPVPAGRPRRTVPHGHYRDWFTDYSRSARHEGRLVFVGLVRRYKGVDTLLRAFRGMADGDSATAAPTLRVAGRPSSDEIVAQLREIAGDDPRISLRLEYLTDADLVTEITSAALVVLPYPQMHNSGTVLAALSLDRPVLVPDNDVNRALAAEVGERWVLRFAGELTAADLAEALAGIARCDDDTESGPDLSRRGWDESGAAHAEAYRQARARR